MSADPSPPVLHFVERWLEPSAQFVHGVITRSRHPAVVVSALGPANLDRFPARPMVSLAWTERLPPTWRRRAVTARLLVLAARAGIGLVHVHFGYRFAQVHGLVRRRHLPWVVSLHGEDVTRMLRDPSQGSRDALSLVDAVVVPSRFLARLAMEAGAREERIRIIPSGVDTGRFVPTPLPGGHPEVVFVGRFVEKKGLDVLVAAWPAIRQAVPEARLRILGYGPLESLARSAGEGVEVVLAPTHDEVRDAIARSLLVVTPSRTSREGDVESLLLVNLEAQASGRAVVTTDHGGIPEYVRDGETAIVVPEGDAAALAEGVIRVVTDRGLAETLGGAGPAFARRFDVHECAADVDGLYRELMRRGR